MTPKQELMLVVCFGTSVGYLLGNLLGVLAGFVGIVIDRIRKHRHKAE